jgi:uncharacterized membrane protein YidH (DUF202 family)
MIGFYKKNKKAITIIGTCLLLICIHFAFTRLGDHISYMHEHGFVHDNLTEISLFIVMFGFIGIAALCCLLWGIWKSITSPILTLRLCKKNTFKIVGVCLVLICIGFSITRFGDHMSYVDAQGWVHDNFFMPGGVLLSIIGCIGVVFTAFGYLLWGIWKCVTTYIYRRK